MSVTLQLLLAISSGIAVLLFLIIRVKLHAFLSLLITSILVGLMAGISPMAIAGVISKGMGDTLAFVATIVGLGAIFGAILEHSGGAKQLSHFLLKKTGQKKARFAMLLSGLVVAIPVFFDVAFIILFPVIQALSKRTRKPILYYALPLLTGIAIAHSFIPPTPGPVAVANILGIDLGWMILLGIIVGLPVSLVCGTWVTNFLVKETTSDNHQSPVEEETPQYDLVLLTNISVTLPLLLMVLNATLKTLVEVETISSSTLIEFLIFIGHPFSALIIATLFAIYFLGRKAHLNGEQLIKISNDSLAPAGAIILITGAGGVFKQMLITTGIGDLIASAMSDSSAYVLLLAYGVAAIVRILQGSATISMITGAGIVAPILSTIPDLGMIDKTLVALAIAAGSVIASHVNDSGFWLVNRFLNQEVTDTLKSWTIQSTAISVLSFLIILVLGLVA